MKAAALMAAVARDQARKKASQSDDSDDGGEAPPSEGATLPHAGKTHLLIGGEVPLAEADSGRTPQPGPPRPDGGHAHSQPVDIAKWKQADYGQMAHAREVAEADGEPGNTTPICF